MKGQLMEEIQRLTRLIEERKKLASQKFQSNDASHCTLTESGKNVEDGTAISTTDNHATALKTSAHLNREFTLANVHVNPNFKLQNPVIHINPRIRRTQQIHVNPRIMKDVPSTNDGKYSYTSAKCSVHINPELMTRLSSTAQKDIVKEYKNIQDSTQNSTMHLKATSSIVSSPPVGDKKTANSNMVLLSRRKLIRLRRNAKVSSMALPTSSPARIKKFSRSPFKKAKAAPVKMHKLGAVEINGRQCPNSGNHFFGPHEPRVKCGRYKIDRTNRSTTVEGRTVGSSSDDRATITIGGILYRSTRNQLVRGNLAAKRRRTGNSKNDKFTILKHGKSLRRVKQVGDTTSRITPHSVTHSSNRKDQKRAIIVLPRINYKNIMSSKVKRRSIQILQNKMRKNNQPCLLFKKFGYCANNKNGVCPKVHDRKQVSLCKKFLQGKCFTSKCPLSHDVGPEKMPTCKYFLEGCCTRDACPYLHIKMSSKALICTDFLQGYCSKGNECQRRHEYTCPEFDKSRNCSKGKYCPYPHKSQTSTIGHTDRHLQTEPKVSDTRHLSAVTVDTVNDLTRNGNKRRHHLGNDTTGIGSDSANGNVNINGNNNNNNNNKRSHNTNNSDVIERKRVTSDVVCTTLTPFVLENRLRYYERTDSLNYDVTEGTKDVVRKKIVIAKSNEAGQQSHEMYEIAEDTSPTYTMTMTDRAEEAEGKKDRFTALSLNAESDKPTRRRPIGLLPAYIPID